MKQLLTICLLILVFSCSKDNDVDLPDADQYLTWEVAGKKGAFLHPADSIAAARFSSRTDMAATDNAASQVYLIINGAVSPGSYRATYQEFSINQTSYLYGPELVMVNIKQYDAVGGYISGSYSGTVKDSLYRSHSISGHFRMRRR